MKIRGYGSQNSSSGKGEDRATAFRRRYRVGDRVTATFIRRERENFCWVKIGGIPLLAEIQSEVSEGDKIYLLVQKLTPQIHLKELQEDGGTAGMPLPQLIQEFYDLREQFEQTATFLPSLIAETAQTRRNRFFEELQNMKPALSLYAQLTALCVHIGRRLPQKNRPVTFHYRPWLAPGSAAHELILKAPWEKNTLSELYFGCKSANCGSIQIHALWKPEKGAYRLFVEHARCKKILPEELKRCGLAPEPVFAPHISYLGTSLLDKSSRGGLLPAYLSGQIQTA